MIWMAVVMVIHLEGAVKTKEGIWCLQQVFKFGEEKGGREGVGGGQDLYTYTVSPPARSANTPLQDGTKMEEQGQKLSFNRTRTLCRRERISFG